MDSFRKFRNKAEFVFDGLFVHSFYKEEFSLRVYIRKTNIILRR